MNNWSDFVTGVVVGLTLASARVSIKAGDYGFAGFGLVAVVIVVGFFAATVRNRRRQSNSFNLTKGVNGK